MHPLKRVYNDYIKQTYGVRIGGDKDGEKTEVVAQKVSALGIDYDTFVDAACSLWHRWAIAKGWKYPYWNLISSDKTFERLGAMLDVCDVLSDDDSYAGEFADELAFALDYIWWYNGSGEKPKRMGRVSGGVLMHIAEYVCHMYGVPYITSDYNQIAEEIDAID